MYYVVFIQDDAHNTMLFNDKQDALIYYNKIKYLKPEIRIVDNTTGEFEIMEVE